MTEIVCDILPEDKPRYFMGGAQPHQIVEYEKRGIDIPNLTPRFETNVPGIYAAGDCAEAFDKVSGTTIVSAIQPNAAEQARVAALNMVGQVSSLRGVTQINVLDTLGLISASFGAWDGVPGGQIGRAHV